MRLDELLARSGMKGAAHTSAAGVMAISYDSRRVQPGSLFVAIRGERTDGILFVQEALRRGAIAIAAEQELELPCSVAGVRVADARAFLALASRAFYGDPSRRLRLAAVTGTNGKTTTTYLMDAIFRSAGFRSCLAGTTGARVDKEFLPMDRTTAEAPDTLLLLQRALQAGCTHGALEVSSHALSLKRVLGIAFRTGIFTNLTPDHLDFHGDMESYYRAKRLLFVPEAGNEVGTAVINNDDPYGRRLAAEIAIPIFSYGIERGADLRAVEIHQNSDCTLLRLVFPDGDLQVRTPLVGRPNVFNILAAAGAARVMGIEARAIGSGIESLEGVPGRMESIRAGQSYQVLVDYAHTPDALEKMLMAAAELPHRRIILLFGCGGDRDRSKRPAMGAIAARLSDRVIATSDNPRTEDPMRILAEIEQGLRLGPAPYELIPDRREAIAAAIAEADAGDLVILAGKGHEAYQVVGNKSRPFDDRAVAHGLILEAKRAAGGQPGN